MRRFSKSNTEFVSKILVCGEIMYCVCHLGIPCVSAECWLLGLARFDWSD